MNWEESKALTPLKRDFLKLFFARNQVFYLTGDSALGIFYLQHRLSFDLDLFTTEESINWHVLENEVLAIAKTISAECRSVTASPQFYRFELTRDNDREIVDLVMELTPQIDAKKEEFGNIRVDTIHEIMVNKICTLISRYEVKDLVDLYFLHKHGMVVADYLEEARKKEGGVDPAMMSFLISKIQVNELPDYLLEPLNLNDFNAFIEDLGTSLANLAFPAGRGVAKPANKK